MERTIQQVAGRVPVLVGISDTVLADSLVLARYAAESGAAAVVAAPPYYFSAGQEPLLLVPSARGGPPLPLVLYNMPEMVKVVLGPELVRRLADSQRIVGLKDSGGDLETFAGYSKVVREVRPDWSLLIGPEQMLPQAHALGGHGGVCGGANVRPRLFVDLQAAARAWRRSPCRGPSAKSARPRQALYRRHGAWPRDRRREGGAGGTRNLRRASAAWFELLNATQKTRIAEIVAEIRA